MLRDDDSVWQDLQHLRRCGVRIAIDDFGTGYSALSYLRHVPLDVVKLDRSFIQSMAASAQQRELVQGIVGLADVLGLQVIAEGIETEHERDLAARSAAPMARDSCSADRWPSTKPATGSSPMDRGATTADTLQAIHVERRPAAFTIAIGGPAIRRP